MPDRNDFPVKDGEEAIAMSSNMLAELCRWVSLVTGGTKAGRSRARRSGGPGTAMNSRRPARWSH
ncbi:hypothetical protein YW7DRAFT_04037 [Streptomyces sp. AmelKG-E11A]|nr:hypothetical protein YW7DRAFT_04037 [Streptomyces sp. AmelKG-E11A]